MKTDDFDTEIRGKLLSIEHESTDREVERIQRFVSGVERNSAWGSKTFFIIYGLVATVLFSSITYITFCEHDARLGKSIATSGQKRFKPGLGQALGNSEKSHADLLKDLTVEQEALKLSTSASGNPAVAYRPMRHTGAKVRNRFASIAEFEAKIQVPKKITYPLLQLRPLADRLSDSISVATGHGHYLLAVKQGKALRSPAPARRSLSPVSNPAVTRQAQNSQVQASPGSVGEANPIQAMRSGGAVMFAGIEVEAKPGQFGSSLIFEARWGNRWIAQTGAGWTNFSGFFFVNSDQYEQQTGKDFRRIFASGLSDQIEMVNIKQNYHLVRIPLSLTYRLPLKSGWAVFAGGGTNFNLYASCMTQYDFREPNTDAGHARHRLVISTPAVNSLFAVVGIERAWSRKVVRLIPTLGCTLKPAEYEKEDLNLGMKIQVLYKLR